MSVQLPQPGVPVLRFTPEGYCELDFGPMNHGWREAVCPVCGRSIRWVLDMMSFTSGNSRQLAHARCVWKRAAFSRERSLAQVGEE